MVAADGPTALARLRALPTRDLTDRQRAVVDGIVARFDAPESGQMASNVSALPAESAALLAAFRARCAYLWLSACPTRRAVMSTIWIMRS
jgi:hypothetical protein